MKCPICRNQLIHLKFFSYKCSKCQHTYVNYEDSGLDYHRKNYRRNNHGTRGLGEIENGLFTKEFHDYREPIVRKRIKFIEYLFPMCETVLDIGAGGGTFAMELKKFIKTVHVQEISELCINNLENSGFDVFKGDFSSIDFDNVKYDLVTCFHVLEHIKDLNSFKKALTKIVNKYVAIEIPVDRPLIEYQNDWDGHYHYFSKESLTKFFSEDFNIIYLGEGVQMPCLLVLLEKKLTSDAI